MILLALAVLDFLLPLTLVFSIPYLATLLALSYCGARRRDIGLLGAAIAALIVVDISLHYAQLSNWHEVIAQVFGLCGVLLGAAALIYFRDASHHVLRMSEARFESLFNFAPDALLFTDRDGVIRLANHRARSLLGDSEGTLLNTSIFERIPSDRHEKYQHYVAQSLGEERIESSPPSGRQGVLLPLEMPLSKLSGESVSVELNVSKLNENTEVWVMLALRDITERQLVERILLRKNAELESFAYITSHDLKAPLRIITNASRWLQEDLAGQLDGENLENLMLIQQRAQRMEMLLTALRDFASVSKKTGHQFEQSITLAELVREIVDTLSPPPGTVLDIRAAAESCVVYCMPLRSALVNLLKNAIKHAGRVDAKITVDVVADERFYRIQIRDNGPGIEPAFHEKIFDVFQTLKPRDVLEGSGMGLAIVRKILDTYGGDIELESLRGEGCCFTVLWPCALMPGWQAGRVRNSGGGSAAELPKLPRRRGFFH
ncbi:hypothetical protein AZF00_15375 [Zhongshania aliphaticivorans]|uniref:histidine kinase n=2 Tax=Zhongshania aliphaticivorans TaxID=1470434 RepID=A0A127M8L6_9GAMM|nr:hypothetical protein AZF00_15375 [Zhongshania aliphaticivorans]